MFADGQLSELGTRGINNVIPSPTRLAQGRRRSGQPIGDTPVADLMDFVGERVGFHPREFLSVPKDSAWQTGPKNYHVAAIVRISPPIAAQNGKIK